MNKWIFFIAFLVCSFKTNAQDVCDDLNKIYALADSLDVVAQQHKGDTAFYKNVVVKTFATMRLFGVTAKVVVLTASVIFDFDEAVDAAIQGKLEMCIERLAKEKKLYVKMHKADANGFRMTSVYKNKKDERSLFFLARGSNYNERTKQLEQNKLYLVYKWTFYK